jgi:hypothetical protein
MVEGTLTRRAKSRASQRLKVSRSVCMLNPEIAENCPASQST